MATKKQNNYISLELEWAEKQLETWKAYIDDNPINEMEDRMAFKQTAKGTISMVSATIESQITSVRNTMKEYLALLKEVDAMREKEQSKQKSVRGQQALTPSEQGLI